MSQLSQLVPPQSSQQNDNVLNVWKMTFQASDLKEKQFLNLLDDNNNIIKPSYTKGGSWLKVFSHSNSLCVCASLSSSQMVDLVFLYFTFCFCFLFDLFFYFLFLEQLGLGLIGHTVTSVTIWWHSHKTDHRTWENLIKDSRTDDIIQHGHHMLASWTTHGCLG